MRPNPRSEAALLRARAAHFPGEDPAAPPGHGLPAGWACANRSRSAAAVPVVAEAAAARGARLVVNVQAAVHKVNARWLRQLVRIALHAGRPLTFRFFPNLRLRQVRSAQCRTWVERPRAALNHPARPPVLRGDGGGLRGGPRCGLRAGDRLRPRGRRGGVPAVAARVRRAPRARRPLPGFTPLRRLLLDRGRQGIAGQGGQGCFRPPWTPRQTPLGNRYTNTP